MNNSFLSMSDLTPEQVALRQTVERICRDYPVLYWSECDVRREFPQEFVTAVADAGLLSVLIPESYGGGGGSLSDAAVVLETINRCGGSGTSVHAQMFTMGTLLRHGTEDQRQSILPQLADNSSRLQAFAVTEPDAGSDTSRIRTLARRDGDDYVVRGTKIFTSRVQHSDYMLLLVRTTRYEEVARRSDGLTVLLVDLREAGSSMQVRPLRTMVNHETNEVVFDDLRVPVANRIGEEGRGFEYILSGMNAERILVASESIGDGLWFIERACTYAGERRVFDNFIGSYQAVQFPLAQTYAQLQAASLMRWRAARMFDEGLEPALEANAAKLLASQAAYAAANATRDAFGGYGLAIEFGIERKFRESRLPLIAPINNNLVLAYIGHKVLGLPKSY